METNFRKYTFSFNEIYNWIYIDETPLNHAQILEQWHYDMPSVNILELCHIIFFLSAKAKISTIVYVPYFQHFATSECSKAIVNGTKALSNHLRNAIKHAENALMWRAISEQFRQAINRARTVFSLGKKLCIMLEFGSPLNINKKKKYKKYQSKMLMVKEQCIQKSK